MVFQVAYRPTAAFDKLRSKDILPLAIVLMLIRFAVTVFNTVAAMYASHSPMFLKPPFGLDPEAYRYYQIYWYGPYGLFMILVIALAADQICKRLYHQTEVTYRKSLQIVCLAFFAPWLPSVPGDWLLIATVNAHPAFLIPFHVTILVWECVLVAIGFNRVYKVTSDHSVMLGLTAGALFLGFGGLLIR